ncbi:MAG: T9SS type A sorting domain-containing protein, partial [Bacteroidota bacterium]
FVDMALEIDDAVHFAMLDMRGRTVMQEQHQLERGAYKIPLDISGLAEGMYTLTVKTTQGYTSLRVMVH